MVNSGGHSPSHLPPPYHTHTHLPTLHTCPPPATPHYPPWFCYLPIDPFPPLHYLPFPHWDIHLCPCVGHFPSQPAPTPRFTRPYTAIPQNGATPPSPHTQFAPGTVHWLWTASPLLLPCAGRAGSDLLPRPHTLLPNLPTFYQPAPPPPTRLVSLPGLPACYLPPALDCHHPVVFLVVGCLYLDLHLLQFLSVPLAVPLFRFLRHACPAQPALPGLCNCPPPACMPFPTVPPLDLGLFVGSWACHRLPACACRIPTLLLDATLTLPHIPSPFLGVCMECTIGPALPHPQPRGQSGPAPGGVLRHLSLPSAGATC